MTKIKVSWNRKAVNEPIYWYENNVETIKKPKVISVSPTEFDNIYNTLEDVPKRIISKLETGEYDYKAIIKSGTRILVIDTQGANYPRYKSLYKK
jgi:hypothetical protein